MKKIIIFFLLFFVHTNLYSSEVKFQKIISDLDKPWSLSFIDNDNIIFTQKSGNLYSLDLKNKKIFKIKHNLSVLEVGQGGLLDVMYYDGQIYISYAENRGDWKTSTSVAKGKFNRNKIEFRFSPGTHLRFVIYYVCTT